MGVNPEEIIAADTEPAAPSSFLERTVVGVLVLLAQSARAIGCMLFLPQRFARQVAHSDRALAPPYSFLILSLLIGGLGVRLGVASFEQPVDHTIASRLAEAVKSISFEDIFVLTVPGVILASMAGAVVAQATTRPAKRRNNPVVSVVCYAAGFQFTLIGACCIAGLLLKVLTGRSSLIPGNVFDRTVLCCVLSLIVLSLMPVYHVIRIVGTTRLSRSRIASSALSLVASLTVLVGVTVVNAVSFDLATTIAEVRVRHQHRLLSDVYLGARTLSSRMVTNDAGGPAMEMSVAVVNVSESSVLLPRPFALEYALRPDYPPLNVLACSEGPDGQAGWVLPPGETRIVRWVLDLPLWCADPECQQKPLPVTFDCFPVVGTGDMLNTHPIGESQMVYAELSWPLSDAWKSHDHAEVTRISRLISASPTSMK